MNIIETNFKWNGTFTDGENKPNKIVLHNAEDSICTVDDIHRWHQQNGWAGIGYHYFIRKDGSIHRGRKEGWRGSHCPNHNMNSIGICFEGKYMIESMPQTQFNAGIELLKDIISRYGDMPIYGHKDLYNTDCPGDNFPLEKFKQMKALQPYVVTDYIPTDNYSLEVNQFIKKYFYDIDRVYIRSNSVGIWIETQYLSKEKCLELKTRLGNLFYSIKED